jgi:hypothetical protein
MTTTPPPTTRPPPTQTTRKPDTSAAVIRDLYASVGKELADLERVLGNGLTANLIHRYRLIQFAASIQTAARRAATHEVLTQLSREVRALRDAGAP